jgi:two-component system, chemotaxis family, chemotaxis protein CheY
MRRALVVDDSLTMREMVSQALRDCSFEPVAAANGQEGLDALDGRPIDLIISDVNMPVMGGLSFIREARAREAYAFVPILVLTTESDIGMKEQGKHAGATGWMVKPFNPDMLRRVIAKVVP